CSVESVPRAVFPERNLFMSRIPMREALIASSAVSVVVSLCVVGAFAAGAAGSPASSAAGNATDTSKSPVLTSSGNDAGNRALIAGSHQGVWFGLAGLADGLTRPNVLADGFKGWLNPDGTASASASASATASASAQSAPAAPPAPPAPPAPKPSPAHEQSRSSALAAVS